VSAEEFEQVRQAQAIAVDLVEYLEGWGWTIPLFGLSEGPRWPDARQAELAALDAVQKAMARARNGYGLDERKAARVLNVLYEEDAEATIALVNHEVPWPKGKIMDFTLDGVRSLHSDDGRMSVLSLVNSLLWSAGHGAVAAWLEPPRLDGSRDVRGFVSFARGQVGLAGAAERPAEGS